MCVPPGASGPRRDRQAVPRHPAAQCCVRHRPRGRACPARPAARRAGRAMRRGKSPAARSPMRREPRPARARSPTDDRRSHRAAAPESPAGRRPPVRPPWRRRRARSPDAPTASFSATSGKNADSSASMPARSYAARTRPRSSGRHCCTTARRDSSASGNDASAVGTTSLNTRAPSEPPSTSRRIVVAGGTYGTRGERGDRRAHRVAGDHGRDLRHTLGRGEAQRQPVGMAATESDWHARARHSARAGSPSAAAASGASRAPAPRTDSRQSRPRPRHACARGSAAPAARRLPAPASPWPPRSGPRPAMPAPLMTNRSSPANTGLCNPPERASVISATRRPRASSSPASASAGKKWPPVPPAAITMGSAAGPLMARRHDAGGASVRAACPCRARPRAPMNRRRRSAAASCPWSG